jgi:hypothetical protein
MKHTPFGYIEKWENLEGSISWRGKFDPMPSKEPECFGTWLHAKTEKKLIAILRSMCKCQITYCSVALEEDKKAT